MLNNRYTQSKIFRKADNAYMVSKIVLFVFWMPIVVMTLLSFMIH
jgi:hypothetical protein